MARRRTEGVLSEERGGVRVVMERGVSDVVDKPFKRKDAALLGGAKALQRPEQRHVDVEVEATVVFDGQISEEVNPLDGRCREGVVER